MLKAHIISEKSIDFSSLHKLLKQYNFRMEQDTFILSNSFNRQLAEVTMTNEQTVTISFSENLSYREFKLIHDCIDELNQCIGGVVQDQESLIGLTQNGEEAYIHNNWSEWASYINQSRYKCLEGKRIIVQNEVGKQLGIGLLADYHMNNGKLVECTIMSVFGEQTLTGDELDLMAY